MDYQGSTTRIDLEGMLVDENIKPKALPFSLLEEITDSFSQYREIGTGGFAVVYKGILETGMVAVKKLSNASIHETEFHREVESLMDVRHKNIVRFLGYCADTQGSMQLYNKKYVMADVRQRLLCFEYLPNRSLREHINDASCGLPWRKRYQIIKGVCEGLNYLHMNRVFHLDLKPVNILMDDNMEPKIADFGLSRCFDEGQSVVMATKVAGTMGYLPPESFVDSPAVTRHYDIYSLGVIITEILTGKRGYHAIEDVLDSWRNRLEESLEDTEFEQIGVCANIGKECTKRNPERRPRSVQHIIDRLKETENPDESSLETMRLSMPTEPGLLPAHQHKLQFPMFELDKRISHPLQAQEQRMWYQQTDDVASRKTNTIIDIRLLAMYAEASGLIGIDGPMAELIQLMDGKDELKVLSIVGFGGLGKTMLANEIFRKLQGEFQCRAFVSVSQRPNIRKLLSTMISQVGFEAPKNTNMENWKEYELINVLRKYLLKQRYLIIIDDIWDASAWDIIRCALPKNINGSRVLITTRIETVARGCCTKNIECVYKMKPLSDQDSRSLFFKRIFGSEDGCPPYLEEVSAQILKKCGGLPLAIITTSSLIASQPSKLKEHWEHLRDSLSSNFERSPSLEGMRQILNLSYINLPHYLKTCMLYLGIYPEDYTIDKNDLMRQWIAEGFICKVREVDLEDISKSYFNELINRGLIQSADINYNREVMSCRVHDMMYDLILHKSRQENFVTVVDDIRDIIGHQHNIQRLSLLDGALDELVPEYIQISETRTLAIFGTCSYLPPFELFKHLHVLRIEITVGSNLPLGLDFTKIHHLFQLRYLKIVAKGHMVVLPRKIESMQQLETFEINSIITLSKGPSFEGLPLDLIHLSRLLHLILPDDIILPNGIGNMKSLRTLHCFNLHNSPDSIKGLGKLTNLTNLKIIFNSRAMANDEIVEKTREVLHNCLGKLCNLKYLYVHFCSVNDADALSSTPASFRHLQIFHGYKFSRVPEWIIQLHSLYDLSLTVKQVFEEDVGILAQLPSVINLELFILGIPEDNIIIHGSGFPVLKHFTFRCSRISCLAFVPRAMPKLEKLELDFNAKGWDRYGAAPTGTKHLSGLREFYVRIGCLGARESNARAAESALRNAIDMHPGRPVVNIECHAYSRWAHDDDEREEQEDDVYSN